MNMKKILFSIFVLVLISVEVSSSPFSEEARLFDHFENIHCEEEKARLDNFVNQLRDQQEAIGYIVFYGGLEYGREYGRPGRIRLPRRNEAEARVSRLKPYIVNGWPDLEPKRIIVVNGGYRKTWEAELWVVPNGAKPPVPTPTLKPEQVKFRKGVAREKDRTVHLTNLEGIRETSRTLFRSTLYNSAMNKRARKRLKEAIEKKNLERQKMLKDQSSTSSQTKERRGFTVKPEKKRG